jgi:F0F1-type ATP synthase epsilon subunit
MHVKVYAPFRTYFDGEAYSLSAENRTGPFDVLPHHKNFMSLLTPCTITVRKKDQPDFNLKVSRGVVHVKTDQVTVFLDV